MSQETAIKDARQRKRMTQQMLADAAGVGVRTVIRAERGDVIQYENLRAICAALEFDAASLPLPERPGDAHRDASPIDLKPGFFLTSLMAAKRRAIVISEVCQRLAKENQRWPHRLGAIGIACVIGFAGFALGDRHGRRVLLYLAPTPSTGSDSAETGPSIISGAKAASASLPRHSNQQVMNWAVDSVSRAYSLDFANYQRELADASTRFTPQGWTGFRKALEDSATLSSIITSKFVATCTAHTPTLVAFGTVDGHSFWKLQIPVEVQYQGANRAISQTLIVTIVIVEQEDENNSLGIASLIAI